MVTYGSLGGLDEANLTKSVEAHARAALTSAEQEIERLRQRLLVRDYNIGLHDGNSHTDMTAVCPLY